MYLEIRIKSNFRTLRTKESSLDDLQKVLRRQLSGGEEELSAWNYLKSKIKTNYVSILMVNTGNDRRSSTNLDF